MVELNDAGARSAARSPMKDDPGGHRTSTHVSYAASSFFLSGLLVLVEYYRDYYCSYFPRSDSAVNFILV